MANIQGYSFCGHSVVPDFDVDDVYSVHVYPYVTAVEGIFCIFLLCHIYGYIRRAQFVCV